MLSLPQAFLWKTPDNDGFISIVKIKGDEIRASFSLSPTCRDYFFTYRLNYTFNYIR